MASYRKWPLKDKKQTMIHAIMMLAELVSNAQVNRLTHSETTAVKLFKGIQSY